MGENRIRDRVVDPLVAQWFLGIAIDPYAGRATRFMPLPGLGIRPGVIGGLPLDGDRDGREAAVVPLPHPWLEGRAAAAVDEHDAGHFAGWIFRNAEPSEDLGGFALPLKRVEIDRLDFASGGKPVGFAHGRSLGEAGKILHELPLRGKVVRVAKPCGNKSDPGAP